MITSKTTRHKQCSVLDRSLIVGGLENIMVDGRGKVRPFGLRRPSFAPTVTPIDGEGNLPRGIGYSYMYTYYDSRNDAESQPSPASDYAIISSGEDYSIVSLGEYTEAGYDGTVIILQGDSLSKDDGHYNGCCISVHVVNDDRRTEYNQWQYRKITNYTYEPSSETGRFVVSRAFTNVDSDPEDQQSYEVKLSDMYIEEGSVGGNSTSKYKVVLDPTSGTDVASYRLKVIHITSGRGEGQTRIIMDAALNKDGLVECTVSKPFTKKPKYVDSSDPEVEKKQVEYVGKEELKQSYFSKWFSSEYVIYDPLRTNGICVDCEVTDYDKKSGIVTVGGLGNGQNLINGAVVEYGESDKKTYIVLSTTGYSGNFSADSTLSGKRLKITQGPGRGREYLIDSVDSDYQSDGSFKCFLSQMEAGSEEVETGLSSHLPNGKSEYSIFSDNGFSSADLCLASADTQVVESTLDLTNGMIVTCEYSTGVFSLNPAKLPTEYQDFAKFRSAFEGAYVLFSPGYSERQKKHGLNVLKCKFQSKIETISRSNNANDDSFVVTVSQNNIWKPQASGDGTFVKWGSHHDIFNLSTAYKSYISNREPIAQPKTYLNLHKADPSRYTDALLYRIYINSLDNITLTPEEVSSGSYCFTFCCSDGSKYYVTRTLPVVGIGTDTLYCSKATPYVDVYGELPTYKDKNGVVWTLAPSIESKTGTYICSFTSNDLMDGYYCGWRAIFYNNDDTVSKPKQKYKESRVHAYFDSTGQLLVSGDVAGIKAGWQCVLFSEYTSCLGSAINAGLCSKYYSKKNIKPIGYYSDYVPLEQFAAAEVDEDGNTPYEGWTLLVLSSSKMKKSGAVKYKTISEKKANNRARTVVKYFPESRRAYVYYNGDDGADFASNTENAVFDPLLTGSEQVWLYDESTAIDAVFNHDTDTDSDEDVDTGCKMNVKGIVACPYDGVDKIRLYRANDSTSTFLRVAELDNKNQDYEDNISEEFLVNPADYSHAPFPPASCCCSHKDRYVCGGSVIRSLGLSPQVDIHAPDSGFFAIRKHETANPVVDGYDYVSSDGTSLSVDSSNVALGVALSNDCRIEFPCDSKCSTDKINISLVLSKPTSDGVVFRCERTFNRSVTQRSAANHIVKGTTISNEDHFYLSKGCDTTPSVYDLCLLRFEDSDASEKQVRYYSFVVTGIRSFIPSSRRFNFCRTGWYYDPESKTQKWGRIFDSVPLTYQETLLYPTSFSIVGTYWRLEYKDGEYLVYDSEHTLTPLKATLSTMEAGSETLHFVSFSLRQGDKCNPSKYILGGDPSHCVPAFPADKDDPTVSVSSSFKFYGLSIAEENNTLISAWSGGSFTLDEDAESSVNFTISGKSEYAKTANGYCTSDEYAKHISSILESDGTYYDILYLGKYYQKAHDSSSTTFTCNYGGNFVFITDPVDGCTEKYTISNTFSFYDEYGTSVVALASTQAGIIVFKERGIYVLNPDDGTNNVYSADTGCLAPDSVCAGRDDIYWLSGDMRVYVCNFRGASRWISKNIHPWFEGIVDFDGWWVCTSRLSECKACYDYEDSQYMLFVPATTVKGSEENLHYLCFLFSTEYNQIFRFEDPLTDNQVNCAFRFKSHFGLATNAGVLIQDNRRVDEDGSYFRAPWFYLSNLRFEGTSLFKKLIKRLCITSYIDKTVSTALTAGITFMKNMDDSLEKSYQAEDRHTVRRFFVNKFSQLIHVGIRAVAWQFRMFGEGYVNIHDFVLEMRSKNEDEVGFHDTPN